ncbi:MAG: hypothetical protein PVH88_23505 [Ignavibacteria bacterium]|jgi:hypothetical protein
MAKSQNQLATSIYLHIIIILVLQQNNEEKMNNEQKANQTPKEDNKEINIKKEWAKPEL